MRTFPRSLIYPGLGEITETDPTKLVRELHATSIAIAQAKSRNDVAAVQSLLQHFRDVAQQYTSTGAAADASEMSWADTVIYNTGTWVEQAVAALPGGIAALPTAIGKGLLAAAIPYALLYVAYKFLTSSRRRY